MQNYSFSQDYNDNPHSDWNDLNFDCSDPYLNPVIDNQDFIQVEENDTNNKTNSRSPIKQSNKRKVKLQFLKKKNRFVEVQLEASLYYKKQEKYSINQSNSPFCPGGCESNELLSSNTDVSSKETTLSSIKWRFDFIATLIKQTKLEMMQLQKYRNDNQQL